MNIAEQNQPKDLLQEFLSTNVGNVTRKTPEIRSYQSDAVVACVTELSKKPRAQCLMAPGSGKTVISLLIKEALLPKITIFFVPSIQLIYQQYMSWAHFRKSDFDALVITSGKISTENQTKLELLRVNHIGTTTDVDSIKHFLTNPEITNDRVIFCTYASSRKVIAACKGQLIDLAIYDEAHHVSGHFDKKSVRSLYDNNIQIKHRLFMTATPKMCKDSEQSLTSAGMNNPELFGEVAYKLSFRRAVELDILCNYEIVAAIVNKNNLKDLQVKASKTEKISIAAVKKILADKIGHRGLSFHSQVNRSRKFSEHLNSVLPKSTYVANIDSSHSADDRVGIINHLKASDTGIISNVRVLGEGFDYDALDFIVMVDPKRSVTDIVQNIGRVIRKYKDKKVGTIVIPIYQEDGEISMDEALNKSNFNQIYHITTALGILDSMLGSEISTQRNFHDINSSVKIFTNKIKVISDTPIQNKQVNDLVDKIKMSALYNTKQRNIFSDSSIEGARALVKYCEKHNRLPPYTGHKDITEEENILTHTYLLLFNDESNISSEVRSILTLVRDTWGQQATALLRWKKNVADILKYCEEKGHRPHRTLNATWERIFVFVNIGRIPKSADKEFREDIKKMLSYPAATHTNLVRAQKKIDDLVLWIRKHKKAPRVSDERSGCIPSDLFALYKRRKTRQIYQPIQDEVNKYF